MVRPSYLLVLLPILLSHTTATSARRTLPMAGRDSASTCSGTDQLCEDSGACCTSEETCCLGTYPDSHLPVVPLLNKGPDGPL